MATNPCDISRTGQQERRKLFAQLTAALRRAAIPTLSIARHYEFVAAPDIKSHSSLKYRPYGWLKEPSLAGIQKILRKNVEILFGASNLTCDILY